MCLKGAVFKNRLVAEELIVLLLACISAHSTAKLGVRAEKHA